MKEVKVEVVVNLPQNKRVDFALDADVLSKQALRIFTLRAELEAVRLRATELEEAIVRMEGSILRLLGFDQLSE